MTDAPQDANSEIAQLIMLRNEIIEQKARANKQFNEEIKAYDGAILDKARNSAQLPLPFEGV